MLLLITIVAVIIDMPKGPLYKMALPFQLHRKEPESDTSER